MISNLPKTLVLQPISEPKVPSSTRTLSHPQIDQSIDISIIQNSSRTSDFQSRVRLFGRFCTLLIVMAASVFGRNSVPDNEIDCVKDKFQAALEFFNQALQQPQYALLTKSLVLSCSVMCDVVFIGTLMYWIFHGKSLRLPVSLGTFTILRLACLYVWHSPIPAGYLWKRPEIPSLIVTFEEGDGYFYAKYLGYMIICAKEWGDQGKYWLKRGIMSFCVYLVVTSLILRANYTIDLFTGAIFGTWFYDRVGYYVENVDKKWIRWTQNIDKVVDECCKRRSKE